MILWTIQSQPGAPALLPGRCEAVLEALRAGDEAERLALLLDPRPLHRALFGDLAPHGLPEAAGTWRGTPGTPLAEAPRAVFVARTAPGLRRRDLCVPADEVAPRMTALAQQTATTWNAAEATVDGATISEAAALQRLAGFLGEFFAIHPFLDGNGQLGRLLALLLADRLGLRAEGWTVHRRPYGPTMSLCLQWRAHHPELLEDHLRRWFRRG